MEADLFRWWLGRKRQRIKDLHQLLEKLNNSSFVHVQPRSELFLERSEFFCKLTRAEQRFAHFHERSDDEHAHLDGTRASENVRCL